MRARMRELTGARAGVSASRRGTRHQAAEFDQAWWFGRFRLAVHDGGNLQFRDLLIPGCRVVPAAQFSGLSSAERAIAYFQHGFLAGAMSSAMTTVARRPRAPDDALFWQFPCRTEAAAWDRHAAIGSPVRQEHCLHAYLGLPWATWIDKERKQAWGRDGASQMARQAQQIGVRLSGIRGVLESLGIEWRLHTVCQHVYWSDLMPVWHRLGVTDLWLSHAGCSPGPGDEALRRHPWCLYAVNLEDPERRSGLDIGRDPAAKPLLASFIGAYAAHYLSDVRLRLLALADQPGILIELTDQWHFEQTVYRHQMFGEPGVCGAAVDASVLRYNRALSDSIFSLCPAGAGANTIRLWESLAVGAVPVLLGPEPRLPQGGTLPPIDWDAIVLRVRDDQVCELPQILRSMPLDEVRRRQQMGIKAYALVREQRCF